MPTFKIYEKSVNNFLYIYIKNLLINTKFGLKLSTDVTDEIIYI